MSSSSSNASWQAALPTEARTAGDRDDPDTDRLILPEPQPPGQPAPADAGPPPAAAAAKPRRVSATEFVAAWNSAPSAAAAAERCGLSVGQCRQRVAAYRKRGVPLVDHPVRQTDTVKQRWAAVKAAAEAALPKEQP